MAGKVNGLAALYLNENPKAGYTHYANHRLKFAICSSCDIVNARNRMSTVKDEHIFSNFRELELIICRNFFCPKRRPKK